MNIHIFTILSLSCAIAAAQDTNTPDFTPVEKFSPIEKSLVNQQMKTASSDFVAACISLAGDVQDKRLTVYAVVPTNKTGVTHEGGFTIRVTYNRELQENYAGSAGSYIQHYNNCLLDFALAQCSEGNKVLGLRLVRLLAESEPELSWSSPDIRPTNIKKVLASLEANDNSLSDMLKEASRDWHQRQRDYKP